MGISILQNAKPLELGSILACSCRYGKRLAKRERTPVMIGPSRLIQTLFPSKLRARIHLLPIPPGGGFLQNCESVDYGFFGNLEVFTKTAFSSLVANIDTCKTGSVSNWKEGVDHGKHGPMGEDLFAEICLRKNGVAEIEAFDISLDGACPAKRPADQKKNRKWKADCSTAATAAIHPFKKPTDYFACMDAAAAVV